MKKKHILTAIFSLEASPFILAKQRYVHCATIYSDVYCPVLLLLKG
jgi:hypothetical protein